MQLLYIDQIPSKMKYYVLAFTGLIIIIAGIFFYIFRMRQQMKQYPQMDENPDSIIGSDPEPQRRGRFGLS